MNEGMNDGMKNGRKECSYIYIDKWIMKFSFDNNETIIDIGETNLLNLKRMYTFKLSRI